MPVITIHVADIPRRRDHLGKHVADQHLRTLKPTSTSSCPLPQCKGSDALSRRDLAQHLVDAHALRIGRGQARAKGQFQVADDLDNLMTARSAVVADEGEESEHEENGDEEEDSDQNHKASSSSGSSSKRGASSSSVPQPAAKKAKAPPIKNRPGNSYGMCFDVHFI